MAPIPAARASSAPAGWNIPGVVVFATAVVDVAVLVAVLVGASAFGVWRLRTDGRMRRAAGAPVDGADPARTAARAQTTLAALIDLEIGQPLGERATLVQFSSAFCAPCRTTRRVLGGIAEAVPGVSHVEVDAESHLDLVRRLNISRTPTTLVLDASGHEIRRAAGVPRNDEVLAVLGEAVA